MPRVFYDYLAVTQPIGTFYVCVMKAADLLRYVDILRRGMTPEERANVQRKLNPRRRVEIAKYLGDPDATFPTSVIIAAYSDTLEINDKEKKLGFESGETFGEVIDGQHRLEGIRLALEKGNSSELDEFELPVVVMTELAPDAKAYVFSIINSKQTQVSSSLIFDLFGLRRARSPAKTCHDIAEAFNAREEGPFFHGIKMLGTKRFDTEILSQGAFVKYLLEQLISRDPDEDARNEKKSSTLGVDPSLPLRQLYIDKQDPVIGKILDNYFSAIRDAFSEEWTDAPKKYMIRKTAGYLALLMVFRRDWLGRVVKDHDASAEAYAKLAGRLRENAGETLLTSANFASSEGGAKKLADFLWNGKKEALA